MDLINSEIQKYAEAHTMSEPPLLQRINRETHADVLMPQMLSGHIQGRVLAHISKMMRPVNILEIGTFTGYSALCLAEGLAQNGKLITIDANEELENRVRGYFAEAGVEDQIDYIIGNALEVIPGIEEVLDLVFIDADKVNYSNYFDLVMPKLRQGGFIIADNVLWSGRVAGLGDKKIDKDTQALMEFNKKVHQDNRVENVLYPIRDGLMIMCKL